MQNSQKKLVAKNKLLSMVNLEKYISAPIDRSYQHSGNVSVKNLQK
jgi:hypothetical protein